MTQSEKTEHVPRPHPSGPILTPRQAEVLDLARMGMSDAQIAARLKISRRSVRFIFEKVFDELGVRDRSEAVTVWNRETRPASRLADRCPYERPFASHFVDCPAYRAVRVAVLDSGSRPTGSIWTCHHLEPKLIPEMESGWYAGCAIGPPAVRERWAAEVAGRERLLGMNQFAEDVAAITTPMIERLWELKHAQRRAVERQEDPAPATRMMEALRDRFLAELEGMLRANRSLLDRHRLSASACVDVARRALDGLLPPQVAAGWNVRFDILLGLPEEAWPG